MCNVCYVDIETEAIDKLEGQRTIRTIHSIAVASDDNAPLVFTSHPIKGSNGTLLKGIEFINRHQTMITHNGIGFDKPVIEQCLQVKILPKQLDTMILAKLTYNKDMLYKIDFSLNWQSDKSLSKLMGSYGLAAFGVRLGNKKIDFEDWSKLTKEMCEYNKQDVIVTRDLYKVLTNQSTYPSEQVIKLEMETAEVVRLIAEHGFYVDRHKAEKLRDSLLHEKLAIRRKLSLKYKPLLLPKVVQHPHTVVPSKARRSRVWQYNPYFKGYWVWKGQSTLNQKLCNNQDGEGNEIS